MREGIHRLLRVARPKHFGRGSERGKAARGFRPPARLFRSRSGRGRGGRRVFVVSGRGLDAWRWCRGRCEAPLRFEAGEEGLARFSAYLAQQPPDPAYVLVDLVEEEFREDSVPRVIGPDRRALIEARRRRLFSDPTWGCSLGRGREEGGRREDRMLFTALTRPERITPWLEGLARNRVPLAGVFSLPLLTEQMLKQVPVEASTALVVTWQSAGGLRQSFFVEGRLKLSRLAVPPRLESGEHAAWMRGEVEKLRRYLSRQSLLASGHPLDVYVVADATLQGDIGRLAPAAAELRYHLVSLPELGARLGIEDAHELAWCDRLFVALLGRRTPRHQYAPARATRDFSVHRIRSGLRTVSLLAVAAGMLGGGSGLAGGFSAARFADVLEAQAGVYRNRYERARMRLPPTPVELPAMRLAVEAAEGLREVRTSPGAVLQALSRSLDLHPGVRLESIDWRAGADSAPGPESGESPSFAPEPRPGGGALAAGRAIHHSADIHGRIEPFDGNYRQALAQVGGFADSLRSIPGVVEVGVRSLPLDIGSGASLRGDAGARAGAAEAPFALRLLWSPDARS